MWSGVPPARQVAKLLGVVGQVKQLLRRTLRIIDILPVAVGESRKLIVAGSLNVAERLAATASQSHDVRTIHIARHAATASGHQRRQDVRHRDRCVTHRAVLAIRPAPG